MISGTDAGLGRTLSGVRRRRYLWGLGVSLIVLYAILELLLLRSYHETERTTRDFSTTTDTTTAIANLQREGFLLGQKVAELPVGAGRAEAMTEVELRRGLLERQLEVLRGSVSGRPALRRRTVAIWAILGRFDRALKASARGPASSRARQRAVVDRSLSRLELQAKQTFDQEEHALYEALGRAMHERALDQRLVVGLSALALLLAAVLAAAIWRTVRRDFARAYDALAAEATEREELQDQLWHQATHDSLTGLGNRVMFQKELEATASRCSGEVALLYIDLDGFKGVNDTLGHDAGDRLLCEVANRLASCLRPGDTLARLGGDEFAILLPDTADSARALLAAERVRAAVAAPWSLGGRTINMGACVGVARNTGDMGNVDELIANADLAMYAAKHAGKGAVRLYDEAMRAEAVARGELETELRAAIERDQLELHYQPIMDLHTDGLVGLEALIRWQHPERGLLAPGEFLPTAETAGLMVPIGRWVLDQACREAEAWTASAPHQATPWVSVNVAAAQLEDPSLVDDVARALRDSGLEPSRLLLELSERTPLTSERHPGPVLAQLQELGVRIALDDFGTGYTALSSLRFLPIDVLKLDKSFIDEVAIDPDRQRIAAAILDLAETIGLETVAEGIEQHAQLVALQDLHCAMGQGFHFSRPVPPDQVRPLLERTDHGAALAGTVDSIL